MRNCPLCHKTTCRIALSGKSGYCHSRRKHWRADRAKRSKAKPGPVRHENLPQCLLDMMRWTFKIVGHYIVPTLEQWELGFMCDEHPASEVMIWHRAAFAFITYHQRKNVGLRRVGAERKLVATLLKGGPKGNDAESVLVRDCWESPNGWKEESERTINIAEAAHWAPPSALADSPS